MSPRLSCLSSAGLTGDAGGEEGGNAPDILKHFRVLEGYGASASVQRVLLAATWSGGGDGGQAGGGARKRWGGGRDVWEGWGSFEAFGESMLRLLVLSNSISTPSVLAKCFS